MIKQDFSSQACALKHILCMGLIDVEQVVTWAESMILIVDTVPDWLTELSLSKTSSQAITSLGQVPGETTAELWWPLLKQQVAKELDCGDVNLAKVVTYCYNLALSGDIPAYDCEALYQLELEYDSIFTGYGTQAEVDVQALQFFHKHNI